MRLHLTIMNKKHFRSGESSRRAEGYRRHSRGSNRQGQRNAPSTPQLWRTGKVNNLGDHAETVGR